MLKNAKWIWNSTDINKDEYVDFIGEFNIAKLGGVNIDISVDGMFAIYVNEMLAGFGECSDDEINKIYDTFCLDEFVKAGKNSFRLTIWHPGMPCSTYSVAKAGCIFSVMQDECNLLISDENILSRINSNFKNGYCKYITGQLGLSYYYDNNFVNDNPFTKSVIVDKTENIEKRPIKNLNLFGRIDNKFTINGNLVTIDMKKETVGFLELDFISETAQELIITYGEHLDKDGMVTRFMYTRDFSVEFNAKAGENKFLNPLRRLAGRYIQFEITSPIDIAYVGLRPVIYPVNRVERKFIKPIHNQIYQTAVYTLECCMHAHYEDCPWREQALYALDSRNQMICGYVAFKEYEYARYNLVLLSRAYIKELQVLNLTYPRDNKLSIPFFSLVYVMQVAEYVKASGDYSLYEQVKTVIDGIMAGFSNRVDESGLIANLPYPFWNFYEWTDGNHNEEEIGRKAGDKTNKRYNLILNAMYVYAYKYYDYLTGRETDLSNIKNRIFEKFYREERGLFISSDLDGNYSVLANVMAVLCGVADKNVVEKVIKERDNLVDISLSMNGFLYEALISSDEKFKDYIIADIEQKYGYMLDEGATTFWETIGGSADFFGAGSLCHGWSALPVYWLDKLAK